MISGFEEFKKIYKSRQIEMANDNFNHTVYKFRYFLVTKEKEFWIHEINQIYNLLKTIIIDYYQDSDDSYLLFCFGKKLVIISIKNLNLIKFFFKKNSEATFYPLSSKAKDAFSNYLRQYSISIPKFSDKNESEMEEINILSEKMQIFNENVINFWRIIRRSISAYLLTMSYKWSKTYRFQKFSNYEKKRIIIDNNNIVKLRVLGTGSSSVVYLIYHIDEEELYALKMFLNNEINNESTELFNREKNFYLKIRHPLLSNYYGSIIINSMNALIIDYINGESLNSIKKLHLEFNQKIKIIFQILIIVEFIHLNKLIYRDLKPNNFIVDSNKTVVLIDRDRMTNKLYENESGELTKDLYHIYLAPEIQSPGKYSYEADIYSIGLLIYFIIMEKNPEIQYLNNQTISIDDFPNKYSDLQKIYESCIQINPKKRPKISELIDFVYIKYYSKFSVDETKTIQTVPDIHSLKFSSFWYYLSETYHSYCQYKLGYLFENGMLFKMDILKAIQYYQYSGEKNNERALFQLGNILREGKYIKKDIDKAIYYYKLSADLNYQYAYYFLGNIYIDVRLERFDISKAIHYYKIAAIKFDYEKAQINLGLIYRDGKYVRRNIKKSIYYFELAADNDSVEGHVNLGFIYVFIQINPQKAIEHFSFAAEKNDGRAQLLLGGIYYDGIFCPRNIMKSIFYFKQAASNGICIAQNHLGKIYYNGVYVPKDINQSIYYLTMSAKNGDANSQCNLGLIYIYEENYIDIEKGIYYLKLSAEKNNELALIALGEIYKQGIIVKLNNELAFHYYSIAADKLGSSMAQNQMGKFYIMGIIVKRNINKAIYYLELSAKKNNHQSQYILALLYYENYFVPRNINLAIYYYTLSANSHMKNSLFELATIYTEGKYVNRNISKAISYYKEASCLYDQYSKNNLGIIFKNGLETPKNIQYAIELFNEAIYQKNDVVSMYNLSHIYFYEYEGKIDECINLLIKSASFGFTPSDNLLCLCLIKKCHHITRYKIYKELKKFKCCSDELVQKLLSIITGLFLCIPKYYKDFYETIKEEDFSYNTSRKWISLNIMLQKNSKHVEKKSKLQNINNDFYEGFEDEL